MKTHSLWGYALSFIFLFAVGGIFENAAAQPKHVYLKLLNSYTASPVVGAHFEHADQKGVSNEKGLIEFNLFDDRSLTISHTSIGVVEIQPNTLKKAISEGFLYLNPREVNLQPVTVIAVRPITSGSRTVAVGTQERLSHDAGALLMSDPSVSGIRKGSSYGFDPVLRGFKYEQLNLTVDGLPVALAACPNRMDPPTSQVSLNMMDKVDIIKGPHALRFGPTTGGTINFVSAAPMFADVRKINGRVSGANELNGDIYRTEGMLGFSNRYLNMSLFGSLSDGNDYVDGSGNTVSSKFYRSSIGSTLDAKLTENHRIGAMATYNVARDVDFPSLAMDLRKDHTTLLKAEHTYNTFNKTLSKWQTSVYYSYVDHLMDNLIKDLSPRMMNASAPANTTSFGGRSEALIMHSDKIIYLGADYKKEEASGNRVRTVLMGPMAGKVFVDNSWQDGSIDKIGVFGELHGKVNGADYIVSVRIDNNRSKISDPSVEFESLYELDEVAQFNPSLSLGFKKDLHIGWLLGAWVARSQRSASLSERFINHLPIGLDPYEMVGNPNLNPEVNHQLDLSVTKVGSNVLVDVGVFGSYLTNMISSEVRSDWSPRLATSPGVRQFTNIDEAMLFGGEVRLGASFPNLVHHEIVAAYTYGQNVTLDEALPEIAPLDIRYHIGGVFGKIDVHPSMTLRHVVAQERVSTVFGENTSKAFTVVDLSLSLKPVNSISLEIGAQNLFDAVYYEHLSRTDRENARAIYSPGRNVYTRLSITF